MRTAVLLLILSACAPTVGEVGLVDPTDDTDIDTDTEAPGLCDDAELGCVLWTGPGLTDCYTERLDVFYTESPGGDWIQANSKCTWQGIEFYATVGATVRNGVAEGQVQVLNYQTVETDEAPFEADAPAEVGERMSGEADFDLSPFDHLEFVIVRVEAD